MYAWDEVKNEINIKKHGVSFEEAQDVFDDKNALYELDDEHSFNEERMVIIGKSKKSRILFVCHCYRESDNIIRIISARKADRFETDLYNCGGVL